MTILAHSLIEQLELTTSALILLISFLFLVQNRINTMIASFAWQSALLVVITLLHAFSSKQPELYFSAGITFALKVILIPYLLRRVVKQMNIRHKMASIKHPFLLLLGAAILVLFCYHLIIPIRNTAWFITSNAIAVAMSVTLLGMLLFITHRKAVSHIIGFMSMENGIFFAALTSTQGMPMIVELGVAFDVLVASVLFGLFFFHMRSSIDSLDVDRLNLLKEDD